MTPTERTIEHATGMLTVSLRVKAADKYSGSVGVIAHVQDGNLQHMEEVCDEDSERQTADSSTHDLAEAITRLQKVLKAAFCPKYYGSAGIVLYMDGGVIRRIKTVKKQIYRVKR